MSIPPPTPREHARKDPTKVPAVVLARCRPFLSTAPSAACNQPHCASTPGICATVRPRQFPRDAPVPRPLCPTIERKICSSVFCSPSLRIPARRLSSDPCATSRPWWMMATWLHSRSTISSTCDGQKNRHARAPSSFPTALSTPPLPARSTPSNGSSRNRIRGP